jgi:hypothetical protein
MKRGRPIKSVVRDRLIELLFVSGSITAYDAYKHYISIFGKTSQRNIYYQLQKGKDMNIFEVEEKDEKGNYSWGDSARKMYYKLSKSAEPKINEIIVDYFNMLKKN